MASLKQADRLMQFTSPAGKDVLLIESIHGEEGISRLFEYWVDLLATVDTTINPQDLVGAKAAVAIQLNDAQGSRYVNGIIASFEQRAGDEEFNVYKARIVPGMWQLTLSSNCRVFQTKTVLDIAKAVIGEYGLSVSDQTTVSYQQLEYCTQYSETDFDFVSRILEESGIFYWFEQTDQDNKIVLGDSRTAYQDCPVSSTVPYALNKRGSEGSYGAMITEFTSRATMVSGKHITADYTYRNFARADSPEEDSASPYGKNAFEQYHYPAGVEGYANDATQPTTDIEKLFIETSQLANDALAEVLSGVSNARSLTAGYTFTMQDNPRSAWNRKYLLTTMSCSADQVPPYRAADQGKDKEYTNQFTAVSSDITYKPAKTFKKPRIYGPQTAKVVGPSGEEIYLDDLGRAKVQFFWDKLDAAGSTTNTTWVRVAQAWAGNGWGAFFWPRVNDEVVIQFLNGDPDNPVISGSVYNAKNIVPYVLPDNGTQSGIVTRSSKGGSASNSNELRFEDKKGSEQIYIHAEKDMDLSVEHDRRTSVGNNDSLIVTKDQMEQVKGDYHGQVQGASKVQIQGASDLSVGGNLTESVSGSHSLSVSSSQSIQVSSAYSLGANTTIYINGGQSVVIEAGMQLSLVCGSNFITMNPAGVSISGMPLLNLNSGGSAGNGSAGQIGSPQSPTAPDTAYNGDAAASTSGSSPASSPPSTSTPSAAGLPSLAAAAPSALSNAAGAVAGAANQAEQAAQQAQQAAQQAATQAQAAADQVKQEAGQTYQAAKAAVQQAQQVVSQAAGQTKAAAMGALNQAESAAKQAGAAAVQAVQQAQAEAKAVEQQAQQAANQAKAAATQAENAARAAAAQGEQAAKGAEAQAQQAANQAKAAATQAENAAKGAAGQVKQAAAGAQQAATQASQAAQQAAGQAANQAKGLL